MKGRGGGGGSNYRNPCLTMHQPWASLLVHGIKRIEGRSWPAPITGRLWIHAASKVPDPDTIKAMEDFYREIYAVNGITDIKFPEHYPVSRLLGCVEVVGCLKCEELVSWEAVPESVRLEGLTDFCWLCEQPQKLTVPFEMRGYQRVYNLEKRIYDAAVRGLRPVEGPQPVKFPLPDPSYPSLLRPGSLASSISSSRLSAVEKPPSVNAAIEGARAAATQFSKKDQTKSTIGNRIDIVQNDDSEGTSQNVSTVENRRLSHFPNGQSHQDDPSPNHLDQQTCLESGGSGRKNRIVAGRGFSPQSKVPPSKVNPVKYNSIFSGMHILVKENGPSSLWRGWAGKFFGYGAQGGCRFGLYEYFKNMYSDVFRGENQSIIFFISSASAQVIADVALCPFEAVKVRVQTQPKFGKGLIDGFPKLYTTEGLSGFYRGLFPLWGRNLPFAIIMFSSFEHSVDILYRKVIQKKKEDCSRAQQLGVTCIAGYASGAVGTVVSNPADNIVSSLYNKKADSVLQAVRNIGVANLFTRSLPIRITLVGPVITLQWFFYDTIKVLAGLPTSGGIINDDVEGD